MKRRHFLGAMAAGMAPIASRAQTAVKHVKIGMLTDFSSAYSDYTGKGSLVLAQLAIEDFQNTVLGKPIELISADFQLKPDIGLGIANQWFRAGEVDVIIDIPSTAMVLALQDVAKDLDKIIMTNAQSSDITGKACSTNGVQYNSDTYSSPTTITDALISRGGSSWFFITVDYALGAAIERDATASILARGGTVVGSVKHPLNTSDFASYLLQAQASGAKVVGFANAGADTANSLSQAYEFGLDKNQSMAAFTLEINDVAANGLQKLQNAYGPLAGYWDMNEATRTVSRRFMARTGKMPNSAQLGAYIMVRHYLKAVQALGTQASGRAVMAKMREIPVDDMTSKKAWLREDGRVMRDMFLVQVKKPAESTGAWDMLKIIDRVPPETAFRSASQSACPLLHT